MKQQADWAAGKPGAEDQMLSIESDTEAWSGRLGKPASYPARLWSCERARAKEAAAALLQANAAVREALFGNADEARQEPARQWCFPGGHDAEYASGAGRRASRRCGSRAITCG